MNETLITLMLLQLNMWLIVIMPILIIRLLQGLKDE